MKLDKKKRLVARTLNLGLKRVKLDPDRHDELKEAITRQDIRDLVKTGVIRVREKKGKKKGRKGKGGRRWGRKRRIKRKKKTMNRRISIDSIRKLRKYIRELKRQGRLDVRQFSMLGKKIKTRMFKSKAHFKSYLKNLKISNEK